MSLRSVTLDNAEISLVARNIYKENDIWTNLFQCLICSWTTWTKVNVSHNKSLINLIVSKQQLINYFLIVNLRRKKLFRFKSQIKKIKKTICNLYCTYGIISKELSPICLKWFATDCSVLWTTLSFIIHAIYVIWSFATVYFLGNNNYTIAQLSKRAMTATRLVLGRKVIWNGFSFYVCTFLWNDRVLFVCASHPENTKSNGSFPKLTNSIGYVSRLFVYFIGKIIDWLISTFQLPYVSLFVLSHCLVDLFMHLHCHTTHWHSTICSQLFQTTTINFTPYKVSTK